MRNFKLICLLVLLGGSFACGGQLYQVATPPKLAPPILATEESGLAVGAVVVRGDEALEQFEANLLLAGVVAVDVRLANRAAETFQPVVLTFALRAGDAKPFVPLPPKKALGRVMKYYGNSLYVLTGYQRTLESYQRLALRLDAPLAPNEERRGFLFFDAQTDATGLSGLTLSLNGGPVPLKLTLN